MKRRPEHTGDHRSPPPPLLSRSYCKTLWKRWFLRKEEFLCQRMHTISLFVFEQGLTSAAVGWWTSVPVGAGPLEPGCHIKPLLCEDQRVRYSCGTILLHTTWSQLRWKTTGTHFTGTPCDILVGLLALLAELCVNKIYMGERKNHVCVQTKHYTLLSCYWFL